MNLNFNGKVAVVTGGAQGIGRQISRDFLEGGAKVVVLDVNSETLAKARKELSSYGEADIFSVNVVDSAQVKAAADKIIDKYSKIDILVNNAGITRDNLFLRLKEEDWDKVLEVNLKGAFNCSKAVLKYMLKQKQGKIVSISSVIALMGNAGQTNYGASKAAIIGFTKSLSKEVSYKGICVNAVAPGYIKTAMTDKLSDEVKAKMLEIIPAKRFGQPEDVSNAVMFLSSSLADYITGKVLTVDGGML